MLQQIFFLVGGQNDPLINRIIIYCSFTVYLLAGLCFQHLPELELGSQWCVNTTNNWKLIPFRLIPFGLSGSENLHNGMLFGVVNTPISFFESNPTGRILNRFDEMIPCTAFDLVQDIFILLSAVILVAIAVYWLIVLFIPAIFVFLWARKVYLSTSRDLKRMDGITR